jgi:LysM repeat protein
VAAQISNAKTNVTATQFETWNPNLQGLCDGLVPGQYVCISAPGGSYVSPPVSNSTTSDNSQQRGGGDGSTTTGNSTVTGPPGGGRNATTVSAGGHAPSPTQSGIAASCTEYAQAQASDGCESLSTLWQVSEQNFYAWNPILGPNGTKCDTEIFSGYYYCVGVQGSSTSTAAVSTAMPSATPTASASATPVSTGPASSAPSPTQSGIVSNCKSYAQAAKGDNCNNFAQTNKITAAQLYSWNPVLGSGGSQCDTEFQAGDFYCIGVSS